MFILVTILSTVLNTLQYFDNAYSIYVYTTYNYCLEVKNLTNINLKSNGI